MTMYALIENQPEGTYTASLIGWPDITAQGTTKDEAIHSLRRILDARLKTADVIALELPVTQPWHQTAGMFKDDPFADEFDTVLRATENPWLQFSDRLKNNPLQQEVAESIAAERSQLDACAEES